MLSKLDEKLEKAFGKKEVKKEDLHPPMAPPKPIERSPTPEMIKIAEERVKPMVIPHGEIDFEAIANSSEFKRFIYYLFTGKTHRGTIAKLDQEIKVYKKVAEDVMETMRGSKSDYRMVMKELKEKLQEVREKNE